MRRDLKLNMSALLWIASRVKGQAEALGELEAASADFLRALKGQDGLAYERLSAEWEENIGRRGKELGNRLEEIAAMVEGYVRDMESLVSPLDEWAPMQVDRDDIWFNYRQIAKKAADFGGILSDTGSTAVDYAGHFVYNLYDSREENEARKARMEEEERKEKARRERNYGKLSGFRALLGEAEAGIHREVEGIGEIYRNHVEPFEDMDDEYGKRMGECYERWSSYWNIVEDRWEMLSETAEGMWDGGKDFVKGVYSMAEGLGAAYTYGKLTGLGLDRLGLVPPELEEKAGKMREGAAAVLRDPGNVLEAVGQEMADRADEKGAAYMAGYVAADIAIGVMLDKGIGKIRGMGKADDAVDVGREASRHADDVAEGLAGKADEIGEAAGCLDDLAGGIGESVTNTSWYKPDGSINYPPNNGAVPGTEVNMTLKPGDTIGRYGNIGEQSNFITQTGADVSKLALPPNTNPAIYQEFEVLKEIPGTIQAEIAPWGGSAGGGLQYELPNPILQLIKEGYIVPK